MFLRSESTDKESSVLPESTSRSFKMFRGVVVPVAMASAMLLKTALFIVQIRSLPYILFRHSSVIYRAGNLMVLR